MITVYFTFWNTILFFPINGALTTLKIGTWYLQGNIIIILTFSSAYISISSLNNVNVNIPTHETFYQIAYAQKTLSYWLKGYNRYVKLNVLYTSMSHLYCTIYTCFISASWYKKFNLHKYFHVCYNNKSYELLRTFSKFD